MVEPSGVFFLLNQWIVKDTEKYFGGELNAFCCKQDQRARKAFRARCARKKLQELCPAFPGEQLFQRLFPVSIGDLSG